MEELYQNDQEFLQILARAERTELCVYRDLVIGELRARSEWAEQKKRSRAIRRQQMLESVRDWFVLILSFVMTAVLIFALVAAIRIKLGYPIIFVLILAAAALSLGYGVTSALTIWQERKTRREAAARAFYDSLEEVLLAGASKRDVAGAKERMQRRRLAYTIHHSSEETLIAKKAKLDEMLGFATFGPRA